MKLRNIRIGKRLFVGFGILELLMVVLVVTGIVSTRGMNERLNQIVTKNTAMIDASSEVKDAISAITYTTLASFSTKDEAYKAHAAEVLTASRAKYKAATDKIEKLEDTAEGKTLLKTIKDMIVTGRANNNKAMELNKAGKSAEAVAVFVNEVLPQNDKIFVVCDALANYERKRNVESTAEAGRSYHMAIGLIVFTAVFAIALATALALVLVRSIVQPIRKTADNARHLTEGDLTIAVQIDREDEFGEVAASMKGLVEKWREIIGSIRQASDNVASASTELSAGAEQMSKGAGQQAERSHQVAAASQEMSQTVLDVANNASSIASTATGAALTAKEGGRIVDEAVKEVKEIAVTVEESEGHITSLSELSQRIGEIIGIINEIADQTNLLALNAAIEAARAGEHGRGFAVVADEVRKLAERTTGATSEVSGIIKEIQNKVGSAVSSIGKVSAKVDRGVELSSKAGSQLTNIVGCVEDLQSMVQQIASAIEEMSATSDQISQDIESISGISQETSRSSQEVASSSVELSRLGSSLQDIARQFRL